MKIYRARTWGAASIHPGVGSPYPLNPRLDLKRISESGFAWGLATETTDERGRHATRRIFINPVKPVQVLRFGREVKDVERHTQSAGHINFLGYASLELNGHINQHPVFSIGGDEVHKETIAVATKVHDLGEPEGRKNFIASNDLGASTDGPALVHLEPTDLGRAPTLSLEFEPSALDCIVLVGLPSRVTPPVAERMLPRAACLVHIRGPLEDEAAARVALQFKRHRRSPVRAADLFYSTRRWDKGQRQLALALIADATGDSARALAGYERLAADVIMKMSRTADFEMSEHDVVAHDLQMPAAGWQPIKTAKLVSHPEVELWNGRAVYVGHWASDLSGSEQPPFRGWFTKAGEGYTEIVPPPSWWRPVGEGIKR